MDNPKQKPTKEEAPANREHPAEAPPRADAPQAGGSRRPLRAFEDAYYGYFRALQESARRTLEDYQAAYREYMQSAKEINDESCRRLEEAAGNYLRELHGAHESDNPHEGLLRAHQRFAQAQQAAFGADEYLRLAEAHKTYRQTVAKLAEPQTARRDAEEAFRNYVSALQRAWSQVNPESLDVNSLAAICNSVLAVAAQAVR